MFNFMNRFKRTPKVNGTLVWPAAVYDAFIAKADEVGGVGSTKMFVDGVPCCSYGILDSIGALKRSFFSDYSQEGRCYRASREREAGFVYLDSDRAVGFSLGRVDARKVLERLGVTRGE